MLAHSCSAPTLCSSLRAISSWRWANRYRVPAVYPFCEDVVAGGLMSYGASNLDAYHIVGGYAGRILSGANPADLPVQQVTKIEFVAEGNQRIVLKKSGLSEIWQL